MQKVLVFTFLLLIVLCPILSLSEINNSNNSYFTIPTNSLPCSDYKILQNGTSSKSYTIVEPVYRYEEAFNRYVEWFVDGKNSSFWVIYAYTLRTWVQDNISVIFEASHKKSAVNDYEEYSFDVYITYKLENGSTISSQFHMGSLVTSYLNIPEFGRSDVSFKNATTVTSGPVVYNHDGIYPFLEWNFTYNNISLLFSDSENTTVDFTITNRLTITETEFKVKIGVLIDMDAFNYSYLVPYIGNSGTFDFIIANSFGVMLAFNNAAGVPIYPSRIVNDTVYYKYENLTLHTLNLNRTYYVEDFNGTVIQKDANVTYEISEWTSFFDYHIENLTIQTARIYLDPEIKITGDFRVFSETSDSEQQPPTAPEEESENIILSSLQDILLMLSKNYFITGGLFLVALVIATIVIKKKKS